MRLGLVVRFRQTPEWYPCNRDARDYANKNCSCGKDPLFYKEIVNSKVMLAIVLPNSHASRWQFCKFHTRVLRRGIHGFHPWKNTIVTVYRLSFSETWFENQIFCCRNWNFKKDAFCFSGQFHYLSIFTLCFFNISTNGRDDVLLCCILMHSLLFYLVT